jgi:hypothetical protein
MREDRQRPAAAPRVARQKLANTPENSLPLHAIRISALRVAGYGAGYAVYIGTEEAIDVARATVPNEAPPCTIVPVNPARVLRVLG